MSGKFYILRRNVYQFGYPNVTKSRCKVSELNLIKNYCAGYFLLMASVCEQINYYMTINELRCFINFSLKLESRILSEQEDMTTKISELSKLQEVRRDDLILISAWREERSYSMKLDTLINHLRKDKKTTKISELFKSYDAFETTKNSNRS